MTFMAFGYPQRLRLAGPGSYLCRYEKGTKGGQSRPERGQPGSMPGTRSGSKRGQLGVNIGDAAGVRSGLRGVNLGDKDDPRGDRMRDEKRDFGGTKKGHIRDLCGIGFSLQTIAPHNGARSRPGTKAGQPRDSRGRSQWCSPDAWHTQTGRRVRACLAVASDGRPTAANGPGVDLRGRPGELRIRRQAETSAPDPLRRSLTARHHPVPRAGPRPRSA